MMPATQIVHRVIAALNTAEIPHLLVGAFARNYLHHWADIHGSRAKLDRARESVPPRL